MPSAVRSYHLQAISEAHSFTGKQVEFEALIHGREGTKEIGQSKGPES